MGAFEETKEYLVESLGMWWPDADEGRLREAAAAWRTFADAVHEITGAAHRSAQDVIEHNSGASIEAFDEFWRRYVRRGAGWLPDLEDSARAMAKALDDYADDIGGVKSRIDTQLEIAAAVIAAGIGLSVATAGLAAGAAATATATIVELAATLGVSVSTGIAQIAATTMVGVCFGGIESVTVELAVAQPLRIKTGLQDGFDLQQAQEAGFYGALLGGTLTGAASAYKSIQDTGGFKEALTGVNLNLRPPTLLAPHDVVPIGPAGRPLLREGDWNAWPRGKRKGAVSPKHRADLKGDEGAKGAHTIDRHVGKADAELRARLRTDPTITGSSSFLDEASAQRFADAAILDKQSEVGRWLDGGKSPSKVIEVQFEEVTGRSLSREDFLRGTGPHDVNGIRVVLRRDPDMESGFRIQTSFPVS
ncbi:RNase A-like domain-containing protein [Streptomyces pathocidini]|uniref:RNase A-like domain-containing protein n=1 Tax=Streptomyces pathocidini TaxID=1650571 RepID=A0ABW7URU0_9ACTN|nr:RNase A-like domain-containing protein [Streptomyces pathocidini]